MDYARYLEQVEGLRAYARSADIPRDPYDIPVLLARRLVSYDRGVRLTGTEEAVYQQAVGMSREHGPCCCHCWRWYAFEGQGRELVARRGWGARQLASLWDLENGCGGKK